MRRIASAIFACVLLATAMPAGESQAQRLAFLDEAMRSESRAMLPRVMGMVEDRDEQVAKRAMEVIGRHPPLDEAALVCLRQVAMGTGEADRRMIALRILAQAQDLRSIPAFLPLLRDEKQGAEVLGLLRSLSGGRDFGTDRASWMAWMKQILDSETALLHKHREVLGGSDAKAIQAAVGELGAFRILRSEASAAIDPLLGHDDASVQLAARTALQRLRPLVATPIVVPAPAKPYVFEAMHAVFAGLALIVLIAFILMLLPSGRAAAASTARSVADAVQTGTHRIQRRVTLVMTTRRFRKKK